MSHDTHQSHGNAGYDKKDVNVRMVLWISAATAVLIVGSILWVDQYVTMQSEAAIYELRLKPDNPQLLDLRAFEDRELGTLRIVDSTKGVFQIPIDRAMDRVVEQYNVTQNTPVSPGGTTR